MKLTEVRFVTHMMIGATPAPSVNTSALKDKGATIELDDLGIVWVRHPGNGMRKRGVHVSQCKQLDALDEPLAYEENTGVTQYAEAKQATEQAPTRGRPRKVLEQDA